jgi:transposase
VPSMGVRGSCTSVTNFWLVLSFRARRLHPPRPAEHPPPDRSNRQASMAIAQSVTCSRFGDRARLLLEPRQAWLLASTAYGQGPGDGSAVDHLLKITLFGGHPEMRDNARGVSDVQEQEAAPCAPIIHCPVQSEVVALCQVGDRSITEVAKDLDLTETAVRSWVQQAAVDGAVAPTGALTTDEREELARLRRENKRLLMEREILKKAATFFAKENS